MTGDRTFISMAYQGWDYVSKYRELVFFCVLNIVLLASVAVFASPTLGG